ncbi:MAG: hypothetical protein WDN75_09870 [Bacteroidota bacterium]
MTLLNMHRTTKPIELPDLGGSIGFSLNALQPIIPPIGLIIWFTDTMPFDSTLLFLFIFEAPKEQMIPKAINIAAILVFILSFLNRLAFRVNAA